MDREGEGQITFEQWQHFTSRHEIRADFEKLGLGMDGMRQGELFSMLDVDGNNAVAVHEFVVGIMRLKGAATSVDVENIMCEASRITKMMRKQKKAIDRRFDR